MIPGAVKSLCNRAILLDGGTIVKDGAPESVLDYYNSVIARKDNEVEIRQVTGEGGGISTRSGNGNARIIDVDITGANGQSVRTVQVGEDVVLRCTVAFYKQMADPTVGFVLRDRMGNDVYGTNTCHLGHRMMQVEEEDCFDFHFHLPLNVGTGNYSICVAVHGGDSHLEENCDWWDRCLAIQVIAGREPFFVGVAALPATIEITKVSANI